VVVTVTVTGIGNMSAHVVAEEGKVGIENMNGNAEVEVDAAEIGHTSMTANDVGVAADRPYWAAVVHPRPNSVGMNLTSARGVVLAHTSMAPEPHHPTVRYPRYSVDAGETRVGVADTDTGEGVVETAAAVYPSRDPLSEVAPDLFHQDA